MSVVHLADGVREEVVAGGRVKPNWALSTPASKNKVYGVPFSPCPSFLASRRVVRTLKFEDAERDWTADHLAGFSKSAGLSCLTSQDMGFWKPETGRVQSLG